ncbi:MAG: hypothetical protein DRJ03_15100 [Chloroflexi bacterium]|nr:MAG: hypothetical protein DRJ03_15100 [Chloroflexota bacterium]
MNLEAYILAKILNPLTGEKIILPPKKANSYVRQFIDILAAQLSTQDYTIKDINGTDRTVSDNAVNFRVSGGSGDTNRGIVIGSSNAPVEISQHCLQSQITTNVAHGAVSFAGPIIDGSTCYVDVIRTFTNNTGSELNIKEVGLYANAHSTSYRFMLDRTLYTLDVPDGNAVTLAYRLSVTV